MRQERERERKKGNKYSGYKYKYISQSSNSVLNQRRREICSLFSLLPKQYDLYIVLTDCTNIRKFVQFFSTEEKEVEERGRKNGRAKSEVRLEVDMRNREEEVV